MLDLPHFDPCGDSENIRLVFGIHVADIGLQLQVVGRDCGDLQFATGVRRMARVSDDRQIR